MSVPDYETLMTPTLTALSDGEPKTAAQVRDAVAATVGVTAEDRQDRLKSGTRVFDSRVHWAVTYMSQAGLLTRPKRGVIRITDRGREVLAAHPDRVDNHVLSDYHEFREFKSRARAAPPPMVTPDDSSATTPRETVNAAVEETNTAVATDVLARVREQDPDFLERLVLGLLTAMGYGGAAESAEHLGRAGDEGLDGVIRQDRLGLDRIYVQAKRYAEDRPISRPDIQGFVGALHGAQADRGVFITTSRFSREATDYAAKIAARVILIDGAQLAALMVEHNIGVQDRETYVLKKIDEDFFDDI